ncbi:MAG: hypothetical protein ACK5T3_18480, partial [Betaproteobacteria bacterium]
MYVDAAGDAGCTGGLAAGKVVGRPAGNTVPCGGTAQVGGVAALGRVGAARWGDGVGGAKGGRAAKLGPSGASA